MGTYAHYRVWAGILREDARDPPPQLEDFLTEIEDARSGLERNGILFKTISMHGEIVGFGVECLDLDWIPGCEQPGKFDRYSFMRDSGSKLLRVRSEFQKFYAPDTKIPIEVYHHIDLGG